MHPLEKEKEGGIWEAEEWPRCLTEGNPKAPRPGQALGKTSKAN